MDLLSVFWICVCGTLGVAVGLLALAVVAAVLVVVLALLLAACQTVFDRRRQWTVSKFDDFAQECGKHEPSGSD